MLKYSVTQENFLEMARFLLKKEQKKFGSILKVVLFTVVQMAAIAYLITLDNPVQLWMRVAIGVLSLVWAGISLYRYFFIDARARQMLKRQQQKDPAGDFWKEHRLKVEDGQLVLTYGATRAAFDCRVIGELMESENLFMLAQNGHAFEILPKRSVKAAAVEQLLETVRETGEATEKAEQEALRREILENALLKEDLEYTTEEYVDLTVKMKRLGYAQLTGWSPVSVILLALPVLLIVYFAIGAQWDYMLFSCLLFLLFNGGQIAVFLPIYKKVVRRNLQIRPEDGLQLVVSEGYVYLLAGNVCQTMSAKDAKRLVDDGEQAFLYFTRQRSIFFPKRLIKPMQRALAGKHLISDLANLNEGGGESEEQ